MIPQQTIEEIKSRMDIYEVVSDFVPLKKAGASYKALSPFTNEKTPSFVVTPSKNIFKCFSTGKGGDAITFLMEIDGLSYVEALKYLAQKYGIAIVEDQQNENYLAEQSHRESLFIILDFAKNYFSETLWETKEGRNIGWSYFKERGFGEDTIRRFDLGYAPDQWHGLLEAAQIAGHQMEFLDQTGLRIVKEGKAYDRFRGRVIFPIHNVTGKVIAFGARRLKEDKSPKYINSPETELYTKSNILYGIFQAKNEIRNQQNCYLTEGYTDVISLSQAGISNVVASSGTSLTEDQIGLIKRYSKNVTVLFDGDQAGVKAAMRGIDMMLAGGLHVQVVPFPEGEDPDSYAKSLGGEAFKAYLKDQAQDFITFKSGVYLKESEDDPFKKAESIREIVGSIARIPDAIERTMYVQQTCKHFEVEEAILVAEINQLLLKQTQEELNRNAAPEASVALAPVPSQTQESPSDRMQAIQRQERESIRMLMNYGEQLVESFEGEEVYLADYFISESEDISFETPLYAKILGLFKAGLAQGQLIGFSALRDHEDPEIQHAAVDLTTSSYEISPHWAEKFNIHVTHESEVAQQATYTHILRLKIRIIQKMTEDCLNSLKEEKDAQEEVALLNKIQHLNAAEKEIAQRLGNIIRK